MWQILGEIPSNVWEWEKTCHQELLRMDQDVCLQVPIVRLLSCFNCYCYCFIYFFNIVVFFFFFKHYLAGNQFKGCLKATCEDLRKSFRDSAEQSGLIRTLIEEKKSTYEICQNVGKCPAQTDASGAKCAAALNKYECNDDIECKQARDDCDDTCFTCFWQVRVWPAFAGECKRSSGGSKPAPEPKTKRLRRLLMKPGLGSPPIDPQPENAKSPAELMNTCWDTWDLFEKSPKARYFAGMVDQMGSLPWEANTVCKCLGICPYDEFEGIQLLSACDWHEDDPQITAALFPDIAPELNAAIRDKSPMKNQILTDQDLTQSRRWWNGARR